jgi:hypothetical protein
MGTMVPGDEGAKGGGTGLHRERVTWPGWFLVSLVLVLVGGYGAALGAFGSTPLWTLLLALPLLLAGYGVWRLRFLEIEFGREGVGYGFGGIRRRVPRGRVHLAEAKNYPLARYMGWGYRIGWEPRERAYSVLGCRRGVLLTFDDERGRRSKVFLSSREPEKAVEALGP